MDYLQLSINTSDALMREVLIAELAELGFESFEEATDKLLAYIQEQEYDEQPVSEMIAQHSLDFTVNKIAQQNWNATWESSFEPVHVSDYCIIRADFHDKPDGVQYDIVITPKMSFGTGHHATTRLMMGQMRDMNMINKKVLDFGSGTGVLAILATKEGAASVTAIDNDEWAYENTVENIERNDTQSIKVMRGSLDVVEGEKYDVILANINRHILLQYMEQMSAMLNDGGLILMSGILEEDEDVIVGSTVKNKLQMRTKTTSDKWMCLLFSVKH
ncbi:MAG: 50S ribosomal protein L11 methyltransferase [Chitinophagales bacterium]|nr:50S ribosomal protein L11 methyltransferase [Chitinophagaceae bacterium]MCB9065950.1 50S ribosomal protein L11 methyltransferase [Chitinophagales bacterium]